jgi:hypothetical protein
MNGGGNPSMPSKTVAYKCGHQMQFTVGLVIAERGHAVAAVGDLFVDLFLGVEF